MTIVNNWYVDGAGMVHLVKKHGGCAFCRFDVPFSFKCRWGVGRHGNQFNCEYFKEKEDIMDTKNCTTCKFNSRNPTCDQGHVREWYSHENRLIVVENCHAWVPNPFTCSYCGDGTVDLKKNFSLFRYCPMCARKIL